jgi:RHS repeat-associated protein
MTYADQSRLSGATSAVSLYGTRLWTYDSNGNRLSETANGTLNSYTYPANNNRLSTVKQGATTTRAFTYDAAGNTTQDLRGATAYNYAVNNAGRIKTLTIGTTLRATWTYDGFQKLRIKAATSPAATTHYIWDSFGHIIAEHNAVGGAALKQYIWLGDTPLAVFDNTTLYYVHPDHLDRPVVMTNASAMTIAWQAKYDPFGNPVAVTVSPVNNQRLPGQWFQSEDGLAYNWHRTYDPTLGRYTQADPLGFVDGPSVYGYAGQSPLMRVDPLGLWTLQIGFHGSATFFGYQIIPQGGFGIAFDGQGNAGFYGFGGIGAGLGNSANAGLSLQGSNACSIYDLQGRFSNVSLHGGAGFGGSFDAFQGKSDNGPVTGFGLTLGVSAGASANLSTTGTKICGSRGCVGSLNPTDGIF